MKALNLFSGSKKKRAANVINEPASEVKNALALVDFENWCSVRYEYGLKPDINSFFKELNKNYSVKDAYFFGNFTEEALMESLPEIRLHTNMIIETKTPGNKKDFTDFIMLDYIYRAYMERPEIDTFVIFTGDGHFSSVASFLKRHGKRVVIYGVKDTISNALTSIADEVILVPSDAQKITDCTQMVIDSLSYLARQPKIQYPTFRATVAKVAEHNHVPEAAISNALQSLIEREIVAQEVRNINLTDTVRILKVDWDKAQSAGLWSPASAVAESAPPC